MVKDVIEYMGGTVETARKLGVQPAAVSQWIASGVIPPKRAIQIERITQGALRATDIMGEEDQENGGA